MFHGLRKKNKVCNYACIALCYVHTFPFRVMFAYSYKHPQNERKQYLVLYVPTVTTSSYTGCIVIPLTSITYVQYMQFFYIQFTVCICVHPQLVFMLILYNVRRNIAYYVWFDMCPYLYTSVFYVHLLNCFKSCNALTPRKGVHCIQQSIIRHNTCIQVYYSTQSMRNGYGYTFPKRYGLI